ncbi:MAG: hypothetical protein ACR2OG_10240, partial [Gemmatimonadaceae bacterium]
MEPLEVGSPAAGPLRAVLDTRYRKSTGRTLSVRAGGDFQAALNDAQPGDVIMLAAGATFRGAFVLPKKSGSGWITVRSNVTDAELPAEGTRMTPAAATRLAKVVSVDPQPALRAEPGAHHYRIMGIEFTVASQQTLSYGVIVFSANAEQTSLDQVPNNLVLDRVYVHGHPTLQISRCLTLNSGATAVIESYLSECHSAGSEAQGIAGWNGPGPFKIVNNYVEGTGENVMFGGADPSIPNLVPS